MLRLSEMQVLVGGRRVSLLRFQERGRGLLFPEDHKDRAEAIIAKVRVKAEAKVGA